MASAESPFATDTQSRPAPRRARTVCWTAGLIELTTTHFRAGPPEIAAVTSWGAASSSSTAPGAPSGCARAGWAGCSGRHAGPRGARGQREARAPRARPWRVRRPLRRPRGVERGRCLSHGFVACVETSELGYPPTHRTDAVTATTSRRGAPDLISTRLVAIIFFQSRGPAAAPRWLGDEHTVLTTYSRRQRTHGAARRPSLARATARSRGTPLLAAWSTPFDSTCCWAQPAHGVDARRVTQGGDGRWCVRVRVERRKAHGALAAFHLCANQPLSRRVASMAWRP